MTNETIGKIVGSFLGAAVIAAGMAAFAPRVTAPREPAAAGSVAPRFTDLVNVQGKSD